MEIAFTFILDRSSILKYEIRQNRFSEVVTKYQTTSHIEEALYRQTEIYTIMGLNDEAAKAAQVLVYNYPESNWSKEAKKLVSKN